MDEMIFTQAIPRVRVLETRLLDETKFNRMIDATSAEDSLKVLQETEYINLLGEVKRAESYEEALKKELIRVYSLLYSISPVKEVVDIMSIKYDYHNMKTLLKAKFLNKDLSYLLIPIGTIELDKLKNSIDNEELRDLKGYIREAIENALKEFGEKSDPQAIDIILDRYMLKEMLKIAEGLNNPFITKLIKSMIDTTNLRTLFRVKKQNKGKDFFNGVISEGGYIDIYKLNIFYSEAIEAVAAKLAYTDYSELFKLGVEAYVKDGKISTLEKLSDNYLMKLAREGKFISFGPEPLLSYLIAKETEIKVIRIIMVGKMNKVSPELIRERLRDIYV
jgi:V/A-type H+-transporting ATPase subunit C